MKCRHTAILVLLCGLAPAALWGQAGLAKVISQQNAVRSACQFFSAIVAPVKYGDLLTIEEYTGDWLRVSFNGARGCIHQTAVEEQTFSISRLAQQNVSSREATTDEVSLAGKGFNPQVESAYRESGRTDEDDYGALDTLVGLETDPDDHAEFIRSGGLRLP